MGIPTPAPFETWKQAADIVVPNRINDYGKVFDETFLVTFDHLRVYMGDQGDRLAVSDLFEEWDHGRCFSQYDQESVVRLAKGSPGKQKKNEAGQEYETRVDLAFDSEGIAFNVINIDIDVCEEFKPMPDYEWFHRIVFLCDTVLDHVPNVVMASKSKGAHLLYLINPITEPARFEMVYKRMLKHCVLSKTLQDTNGKQVLHVDAKPIDWTRLTNASRIKMYDDGVTNDYTNSPIYVIHDGVLDTATWKIKAPPKPAYKRVTTTLAPDLRGAAQYVAKVPGAVSGEGGHNQTFRLACAMIRIFHLGEDQVLQVLEAWNEQCDPPWSEHDLQHKVRDAIRATDQDKE